MGKNTRINNPYVAQPRRAPAVRSGHCGCCDLPFKAKPVDQNAGRLFCDFCREHYEIHGESAERRDARLVDDRKRVAAFYVKMSALLDSNERQLKNTKEQVHAALSSRDLWRAQIEAVLEVHKTNERGDCVCGQRPCRTRDAIDNARHARYEGDH